MGPMWEITEIGCTPSVGGQYIANLFLSFAPFPVTPPTYDNEIGLLEAFIHFKLLPHLIVVDVNKALGQFIEVVPNELRNLRQQIDPHWMARNVLGCQADEGGIYGRWTGNEDLGATLRGVEMHRRFFSKFGHGKGGK